MLPFAVITFLQQLGPKTVMSKLTFTPMVTRTVLLMFFSNQQQVGVCVHFVKSIGNIDAEALWLCVGCADPDALPDYVTDPHRPEFN
jgi:hypothetical protein